LLTLRVAQDEVPGELSDRVVEVEGVHRALLVGAARDGTALFFQRYITKNAIVCVMKLRSGQTAAALE
jgi:hypothetical protein